MSALFAAVSERSLEAKFSDIGAAFDSLNLYGPDGGYSRLGDKFFLGCQQRCQFDEDQQGEQPFKIDSTRWLLWDGRLDNREELAELLGLGAQCLLSDAALIARWIKAHADYDLNKLIGPFALIIFDEALNSLTLARDPMGGRSLTYTLHDDTLVVSTDESAFCKLSAFSADLNTHKVVNHLSFTMDSAPNSFFASCTPVFPGEIITWQHGQLKKRRFYKPPVVDDSIASASLQENAQQFRRLLDKSVCRRLRGAKQPAIMLSGGLDSIPIAISASRLLEEFNLRLNAYSWTFTESRNADETHISAPFCADKKIKQTLIDCDRVSLTIDSTTVMDRRVPFGLPFTYYQVKTLKHAKNDGTDVLLSGMHGDLLYSGADNLVVATLRKRGLTRAIKEFFKLVELRKSTWQAVKRYLLLQIPFAKSVTAYRRSVRSINLPLISSSAQRGKKWSIPWLWAESRSLLRPEQYQKIFDGFPGEDLMHARQLEQSFGVERRYPFRDRDLCEFVLNLPSEHLFSLGESRPIVKEAFKHELPEIVSQRNDKTTFVDAVIHGIQNDFSTTLNDVNTHLEWQTFLDPRIIDSAEASDTLSMLALWRASYYNEWCKRYII